MGEGAERGEVALDERVDEGTGVADAELEVGGDVPEGMLEAVGEVEGGAAGGEAVEGVAGGRGGGDGDLILEAAGDELGVEAEEDVAWFAAAGDEERVGAGIGGAGAGEAVEVDGDGDVDGEDVVEAVADGGLQDGGPAGLGVVQAGEGDAAVEAAEEGGEAGDLGDFGGFGRGAGGYGGLLRGWLCGLLRGGGESEAEGEEVEAGQWEGSCGEGCWSSSGCHAGGVIDYG